MAIVNKVIFILKRGLRLCRDTFRLLFIAPVVMVKAVEAAIQKELRKIDVNEPSHKPEKVFEHLPSVVPINFKIDSKLAETPRLNVMIPSMKLEHMSGGPNTAINFACRLAQKGVLIRFISTCGPAAKTHEGLYDHFESLVGEKLDRKNIEIACGFHRDKALRLGENDRFFATAWWTAQMVKSVLPKMKQKKFIYFIQDFEPGLYPWSAEYALAMETYSLDIHPIFNTHFLATFFFNNRSLKFDKSKLDVEKHVFDPSFDRKRFHFQEDLTDRKKRLVFYARPNLALRNLFELGLKALDQASAEGALDGEWELLFIGDKVAPTKLASGQVISNAPWLDFDSYAEMLRNTDIALSLMLSPHPSYLPFESAACGALTVTNTYDVKTADMLKSVSHNILACEPTVEKIKEGIVKASQLVSDREYRKAGSEISLPRNWTESFESPLEGAMQFWNGAEQSVSEKSRVESTNFEESRNRML